MRRRKEKVEEDCEGGRQEDEGEEGRRLKVRGGCRNKEDEGNGNKRRSERKENKGTRGRTRSGVRNNWEYQDTCVHLVFFTSECLTYKCSLFALMPLNS